jgi:hypothetical protein
LTGFSDNLVAGGSNRRSSSENISFRLQKNQLDQLRQEAKEKRISLNTLASQIFDSYLDYTANASKADMVPFSRRAIVSLLDGYDDEQIKTKARDIMKQFGKDIALQLRGRYDFETLIDILDSWLLTAGFPYRHNQDGDNKNRHTFIVLLNMGRKSSVFVAEGLKSFLEPQVTKKAEFYITDNIIAITVEGK